MGHAFFPTLPRPTPPRNALNPQFPPPRPPAFQVDAVEVSPDQKLLAWAEDTVGGEKYTVHVKARAWAFELPGIFYKGCWGCSLLGLNPKP